MTTDEIARAQGARWAALCRLSRVVQAIQKLPEDAPEDVIECLESYLDDLQEAYVLAFEAHKAAVLKRT
jgi:hypothetical protein